MTSSTPQSTEASACDYAVVIVGFGPVGAVTALWLGQAGIRTLVVDKSDAVWQIPRAIAIDHEILRTFQNLGVAEEVLPYTAPFKTSEHFGVEGQLIRRIHIVEPPFPLGYTPTMVFTQPPVEAVLRKHVAALPSVTIKLGSEVTGVVQDELEATVELKTGDALRSITANFVVACDGASSSVRRMLGIKFRDLGFDEPWLVVDVMVLDSALHKLPQTSAQYCNPQRPTTFIVGPGNHRRWEIMLSPEEDPREMEQPDSVWKLLAPWLQRADGILWRASSYRFHALIAAEWRMKRIFLAGDAAHQQPPFIGQGMCQGIRDATNLSWKLAAVLQGTAPGSLLDTYEQERSRHVHTLTSRIKTIGHHICERDPTAARERDATLLRQGGGYPPTVTRQEIVPPLEVGLIADTSHAAHGSLFPQPWILTRDATVHMDTLAGHGWRLILDGRHFSENTIALPEDLPMDVVRIGPRGLSEQDGVAAAWFDQNACVAAIVRPDHYVYAVARTPDVISPMLETLRFRTGAQLARPNGSIV